MNPSLKILILKEIFALASLSYAATTASDASTMRQLTVGQVQVSLEDRNGKCHALAITQRGSAAHHALDIP
jgi:hypothetical protein